MKVEKLSKITKLEQAHEALLLTAVKVLPSLIANTVQGPDGFHAFVEAHLGDIHEDIDKVIEQAGKLGSPPAIVQLYKQARAKLPDFDVPELDEPDVSCGVPHVSRFGFPIVVDMMVDLSVPHYSVGVTSSDAFGRAEVTKVEHVVQARYGTRLVEIPVEVFPRELPLRRIIDRLGEVRGEGDEDHLIAVVERREVFDALSSVWDVVLIEEGVITDYSIGLVEGLPTFLHQRTAFGA